MAKAPIGRKRASSPGGQRSLVGGDVCEARAIGGGLPDATHPLRVRIVGDSRGVAAARVALDGAGDDIVVEESRGGAGSDDDPAEDGPDVVLLDVGRQGSDAARALSRRLRGAAASAVIVLADDLSEAEAIADGYPGAHDYVAIDGLVPSLLLRSIRHAGERRRLEAELERKVRSLEVSEAALRTIVHSTADAIVIVDVEGTIRFVNPAAERIFARDREALLGQPFGFPVVAGETTEIDIVRQGGVPIVAELRASDTEWRGEPARLASIRDITERRRAEEHARELIREQAARAEAEAAERRSRFLGEASTILAEALDSETVLQRVAELAVPLLADLCVIDLIDDDGVATRVAVAANDPFDPHVASIRELLPETSSSPGIGETLCATGKAAVSDVDPDVLRTLFPNDELSGLLLGHRLTGEIVPLRNRDRTLGCLALLRLPERSIDPALLPVAEELARRAAIAVDNARLFHQAQQANKAKTDFLAVISHELRTPLNAVIGYSDLLLLGVNGSIDGAAREYIDRIRTSATHLLMLIEEILTHSRVEAGREQIHVGPVGIGELIKAVANLVEPLAIEKRIGFACENESVSDTVLESDAGKLRQILLNLLSNAIKFTDEGGVRLVVSDAVDWIEFRVIDTGGGISEQHLERIFEPFWQAEQSRTRRAEGTGLGLSVARRLTHLLGGDLLVNSRPGQGSTFTVRVPRRLPKIAVEPD